MKICNYKNHRRFSLRCLGIGINLVSIKLKNTIRTHRSDCIIQKAERSLLNERIRNVNSILDQLKQMHSTLPITKVAFNKKSAIRRENLHTKYTPFAYNDVTLNEKLPIMKQNLCIFFFIIGGVECRYMYDLKLSAILNQDQMEECKEFIEEHKEARHMQVMEHQKKKYEKLWWQKYHSGKFGHRWLLKPGPNLNCIQEQVVGCEPLQQTPVYSPRESTSTWS